MENTILHLHLYLYTDKLINIARQNIKKMKSYGFKILITSGLHVPEDFYDFCDYIFIDHENIQFTKKYISNNEVNFFMHEYNIELYYKRNYQQKHALAVLNSIIKGCKIAELLGYKNILKLVYDCDLGEKSFEKIKECCFLLENSNHDMILYEDINDFTISGQIFYYKTKPMLSLFENIDNENEYERNTLNLGHGNVILDLEKFMYNFIKNSPKNILFLDNKVFFDDYPDTQFNEILSTKSESDKSGFMYDVMHVVDKDKILNDEICLSVYNQQSDNTNTVIFNIFGENYELITTKQLNCNFFKGWSYHIYNVKENNIKYVETHHLESDDKKTYTLYYAKNLLTIISNDKIIDSKIIFTK